MLSVEEFAERLIRLGAGWTPRPLPRKRRDREILMKSVLLTLDSDAEYSELEINERLQRWMETVAKKAKVAGLRDGAFARLQMTSVLIRFLHPNETIPNTSASYTLFSAQIIGLFHNVDMTQLHFEWLKKFVR